MSDITEIRWHGRGGQGVVTASELLAEAVLEEGKHFQAFPDYGPERMGAPIRAYTRLSSSPIRQHCQITEPDAVVVLDPTLIGVVDFTEGLKDQGVLVVNTRLSPIELRRKLEFDKGKVFAVDATRIALDTIGRNIPNMPMIGALLRASEVVDKEGIYHEIRNRLGARMAKEMMEANIEAFERAYNETREG
ncbi:MAG: 2-oxoacid:acceptor oxidoreductase family protein [Dehalococcoidia bacterium]